MFVNDVSSWKNNETHRFVGAGFLPEGDLEV